jgi:MFS family permease
LALLPVVARDQFGVGAVGFGLLFSSFGTGAVAGALSLSLLLQKQSLNTIASASAILSAIGILLIAATPIFTVAVVGALVAGAGWGSMFACLSAGTLSTAPAWVRARAVSFGLVAMQTALAIGSVVWGLLASTANARTSLAVSAVLMILLLAVSRRTRLALGAESSIKTGLAPPELVIPIQPAPDDGPVVIQLEYSIDPENHKRFLELLDQIEPIRRRNGVSDWRLFRDVEQCERFVERFLVASWGEYIRLRARVTPGEDELRESVTQLQRTGELIRVSRLIATGRQDA